MENENIKNEQHGKGAIVFKKVKIITIVIIVLGVISFGVYGYFWFQSTKNIRAEAEAVVGDAKQYNLLKDKIQTENSRCKNFISQKEGDFGSFEYCKKYIKWSEMITK